LAISILGYIKKLPASISEYREFLGGGIDLLHYSGGNIIN